MGIRASLAILAGSLFVMLPAPARAAAQQNPTALEQRAAEVAALFRADPGGYEKLFTKDFLAQVPRRNSPPFSTIIIRSSVAASKLI